MVRIITRSQIKMVLSLRKRRVREELSLFVIEGDKLVREYIRAGNRVVLLAAKPEWLDGEREVIAGAGEVVSLSYDELRRISSLKTPHNVLAVASIPQESFSRERLDGRLTPVLDSMQDPGNLGTIIRIAAWFGHENIICSPDSVDLYNPKVIQATMGAFVHVRVWYMPLAPLLADAVAGGVPVWGATTGGTTVYESELGSSGLILFGNESRGISPALQEYLTSRITIPGPAGGQVAGAESLNVSMAAAIICSEFARRPKSGRG